MGEDAYIDEDLKQSIERIQEIFGCPTFTEASRIYDKLARKATVGEIIEEGNLQDSSEEEEDMEEKFKKRKEQFLEKKINP